MYSISLSSHTKFLFYVYFMLTVATGGNNLATICYKDFLGLATINMYYYYYYTLKQLQNPLQKLPAAEKDTRKTGDSRKDW